MFILNTNFGVLPGSRKVNFRGNSIIRNSHIHIKISMKGSDNTKKDFEKVKIESEKIHFQGPPSLWEILIPTLSLLTVIGIIPFFATLTRQFWVNYKITNRRISVNSGLNGKEKVEIVYRDIKKINYITRFGGNAADVVLVLKDNAQLELRSLPDWENNLNFIKNQCDSNIEVN
jgi:hypothetical protein